MHDTRSSNANYLAIAVLQAEMQTCMRLLGAKNIDELGPRFVCHSVFLLLRAFLLFVLALTNLPQINSRAVERDIYDGEPGLDKNGLWEKAASVVRSKL